MAKTKTMITARTTVKVKDEDKDKGGEGHRDWISTI